MIYTRKMFGIELKTRLQQRQDIFEMAYNIGGLLDLLDIFGIY